MLLRHLQTRSISTFGRWYRKLWQSKPSNEPPFGHVTQIGDPVLRQTAALVPAEAVNSPEVKYLVKHMVHVMRKYDCVGLAAPQIGISLKILVMEFEDRLKKYYTNAEYKIKEMETLPLTVRILFHLFISLRIQYPFDMIPFLNHIRVGRDIGELGHLRMDPLLITV